MPRGLLRQEAYYANELVAPRGLLRRGVDAIRPNMRDVAPNLDRSVRLVVPYRRFLLCQTEVAPRSFTLEVILLQTKENSDFAPKQNSMLLQVSMRVRICEKVKKQE